MANTPGPTVSTDVVTDLVARYGRQAIQLFAALAGATGLFYAIGFVIVNFNLLQLGVYETALISVGYVVPGIAFVILVTLLVVATIGAFAAWRRLLGPPRLQRVLAALLGILTLIAGWLLLGWAMGFFQDVASGVVMWGIALSLIAAIMAYAENLPLVNGMIVKQTEADGSPLSPIQARLKSPAFLLVTAAILFFGALAYGLIAYDQVPPALGGGLPSVVRFFGEDVDRLGEIRIGLEPGTTNLTERVELIAQTEDRYIVRVADQAVSFDKSFVQGIRYELPEFFFDEAFFLLKHTGEGERLLGEKRFDQALSEFKLVLGRDPNYVRALHGRVRIFRRAEKPDFEGALEDYRTLTQVEPQNGENFYDLAQVHVLRAQSPQDIEVDNVVSALMRAKEISATLGENAQADPVFDRLRGIRAFDKAVYGSGPDAARWFRDKARSFAESGAIDEAILALRRALTYTAQYAADPSALSPSEVANLHIDLSQLHLRRDPLSGDAVAELDEAVKVPGLSQTEVAEGYVRLSGVIRQRDPLSDAALAALQAAVDVTDEKDPKYLNLLGDLYRARGDSAKAVATYDLALRRSTADDPNRRQALTGQGAIALEAQEYLLASAAFSQALTLSASDAATWYDYARALAALGDAGTEAAVRRAIELNPNLAVTAQTTDWQPYFSNAGSAVKSLIDGAVFYKQAREFRDQGDRGAAIADYQKATSSDPTVAAYWHELGDLFVQEGRHAEAIVAYQNALPLVTDLAAVSIYNALGQAQIQTGAYAGAIESLTKSINAQAGAAPAVDYARLANAYELAGQLDLAAATYGEAARRDPSSSEYPYRAGIDLLLANQIDQGLAALNPIIAQGGLRVESTDVVGVRDVSSESGAVLKTLAVGAVLRITANPQVNEGQVWWPVADQEGTVGWVRATGVVPSPPPAPPVIQSTAP